MSQDLFIYCDYIETRLRQENQRLSDCELDLSDATKSRRELQHRIKTSEEKQDRLSKENEALKVKFPTAFLLYCILIFYSQTRNPYVLALIDGDGLIVCFPLSNGHLRCQISIFVQLTDFLCPHSFKNSGLNKVLRVARRLHMLSVLPLQNSKILMMTLKL